MPTQCDNPCFLEQLHREQMSVRGAQMLSNGAGRHEHIKMSEPPLAKAISQGSRMFRPYNACFLPCI